MTLLLASVTGPDEARIVLDGGADIIDLKDPARGALGAVAADVIAATVASVAGRRPVSAVAGDLPLRPAVVAGAVQAIAAAGVDYVKLGLFPGGDLHGCLEALVPLAGRVRLIAVLFADLAPDFAVLPQLAAAGFAGAMLDTARKDGSRLLDHLDLPALARFVAACHTHGLRCGLAGALEPPDIPRLLLLQPGLLGFRGALCGGNRTGRIDPEAVRAVRALIPAEADTAGSRTADQLVLAARGYAPDPHGDPATTDRVFVCDLVLPVSIGVYARERDVPQRVRFDIEVLVARPRRTAQSVGDIYSYDIISDTLRLLAASGHVGLVETLAERIAALLLGDPRVMKAAVRLEKLDTGNGRVGVAIERTRETLPAAATLFATWPDAANDWR